MKYAIETVRRIEVKIVDEAQVQVGMAYMHRGKGWNIFSVDYKTRCFARKKGGIVRSFAASMGRRKGD